MLYFVTNTLLLILLTTKTNAATSCSSGHYLSGTSCYYCRAGTYSSGGTTTSCSFCSPGYYSGSGASSCTKCNPGYYASSAGSSSCTNCNPGKYASSYGSASCSTCSAGTYSGTGASSCTKCSAGYYSGSGASSCSVCSAGTYSSSGSSTCTKCNAGSYSSSGSTSCKLCDAGTYSSNDGASSCKLCNAGSYSNKGATTCTTCTGGYYSQYSESASCTACAAGTRSEFPTSSTKCVTCSRGTYSSSGSAYCNDCRAGTYADEQGSSSCKTCADGFYSTSGSSTCVQCISTSCGVCSITTGECTSCNVGYSYDSSNKNCSICPASYYSSGGTSLCSKCATGYYSLSGSSGCTKCLTSCKTCDQTNGNCLSCYDGYFMNGKMCDTCSAGTYQSGGSCVTCADMQYSLAGSTTCKSCSSTCLSCDKTNGYCTSCESGMGITTNTCSVCSAGTYSVANNCEYCPLGTYSSSPKSLQCSTCADGTYANTTGSTSCKTCNVLCEGLCERTSGKCVACVSGAVYLNGVCSLCNSGTMANQTTNNCDTCKAGTYAGEGYSECKSCGEMTYSTGGSPSCQQCDSHCDGCDATNGYCVNCVTGYGLAAGKCAICPKGTYYMSSVCQSCGDMEYQDVVGQTTCKLCDLSCASCNATNSKCLICAAGYGFDSGVCTLCGDLTYSEGGVLQCQQCSTECKKCDRKSGACTSCEVGNKRVDNSCVSCAPSGYCDLCTDETSDGICVSCEDGFYLNESADCQPCSDIHNDCLACSKIAKTCLSCAGNMISTGTSCVACEVGMVKVTETTCDYSYNVIPKCQIADYANSQHICTTCFAPYVTSSDLKACNLGYTTTTYYDTDDHQLRTNMDGCINQIDTMCYLCDNTTMLLNGVCNVKHEKCGKYSQHGCDNCVSDVITSNGNCVVNTNCKYEINREIGTECLYCVDDVLCGKAKQNCETSHNEYCYLAISGYHTTNDNTVERCESEVCVISNGVITDLKCQDDKLLIDGVCTTNAMCIVMSYGDCIKCDAKQHISHGMCSQNNPNCDNQNGDICIVCNNSINVDGVCTDTQSIHCSSFDKVCVTCESGYYKDVDGCKEKTGVLSYCDVVSSLNTKCVECESDYNFNGISCVPQTLPNETTKQTTKNVDTQTDSHCEVSTTKGCLRCLSGYYLADRMCVKCEYPCVYCSNQTFCTKCDDYSYANSNGVCTEINALVRVCDVLMSTYRGCVVCKNGYMRSSDGTTCIGCDESCKSCTNEGNCVVCNEAFYRTSSNVTKLCSPQSELTSCANKTTVGCMLCESGYYLSNNLCAKCQDTCTQCYGIDECTDCVKDNVLVSGVCSQYTVIENCVESANNKCSKCDDNYKLSDDMLSCIHTTNYGVVVGIPIVSVFIIVLIIIGIIVITIIVLQKRKETKKMENICVFKMSRSNIAMSVLDGNILTNKKSLTFDDTSEVIPVEKESRELLCVGNKGKGVLKVQITTRGGCDKYSIRTEPQLVTLKKGEACESEVFVTPHCSMKLHDEMMIVTMDILNSETTTLSIPIILNTENSTKLDYDELKEDKKLGEGSFGIVYKGTYRGNVVAIKKLKEVGDNKGSMEEFENEVSMLDKFRSEYIVHFYGAVSIPSKVCMVTEFAQYGSLNDLIKKTTQEMPRFAVRVKLMLDASKGISYLHENNILHRDIKPDNFLVFCIDNSMNVSAKLTDFGSSRNVNMLTTNMTFTKGIGTPKFMAPEVLEREKYKKPADVYSFAMTMYEAFTWDFAFKNTDVQFKYAWSIADFTSSGKRLQIPTSVPEELSILIQQSWEHNPKKRLEINNVTQKLQEFYKTVN
ncbi:protein serine/threonine kinase, putative [Entamoeba invadens IP1]|uniref:Protein serine/threonine kinase, putative n=1 Tax=Entamoeba invadens IP1 TaxID=370355 RepID=L7FJN8_ENTIV|nr:protein serine/threonine kinase, putative [Entamoeba invadens IP1]ELP83598.1 protein serine/threonine kinase, putative [Entamoeba invadens IP1]|eukprot:XP_004182944.1 protein serine/threonine kinase, putative [Entamoeba invadens IP1]